MKELSRRDMVKECLATLPLSSRIATASEPPEGSRRMP